MKVFYKIAVFAVFVQSNFNVLGSVVFNVSSVTSGKPLSEFNINIDGIPLTFLSSPNPYYPLTSDLSFIPKGTTEITLEVYGYGKSLTFATLADLATAINNNTLEGFAVQVYDGNSKPIGTPIALSSNLVTSLKAVFKSGKMPSFQLGVNAFNVTKQIKGTFSYPISLTLQSISGLTSSTPKLLSRNDLIGKNQQDFQTALGISTQTTLYGGSLTDPISSFNFNIPTPANTQNGEIVYSGYAFVRNPWRNITNGIQVASQAVTKTEWQQIYNALSFYAACSMSLVAFDGQYNYIAEPWNNTPEIYSLFIFDYLGNPVKATNDAGQVITPITFSAYMYTGNLSTNKTAPKVRPISSTNPIQFGGLNTTSTTYINSYPFILAFYDSSWIN